MALRACQRLAVTVPPLDDTSLERIEELVDAAQWRTALGEALTRLSTALTRRGDYAVRAALCLAKRGGSSQYVAGARLVGGRNQPVGPG